MMIDDDAQTLEEIKIAIEDNNIDKARSLLRPLMERNIVEAFYFASRVAYTQEQALEFLRYALQLDPKNTRVRASLDNLEALYKTQTQNSLVISDPNVPLASNDVKEKVEKTLSLFRQYHWQVISHDNDHAQLWRRQTMTGINAFVLGIGLHVIGFILTGVLLATADKMHVFIEADEDVILLTTSKGNTIINRPEQAVIFLDKTRGTTFWRGLFLAFAGVLVTTLFCLFLAWQAPQFFEALVPAIATEVFAPDI